MLSGKTPAEAAHTIAGLTRLNFLFRLYDGAVKNAQIVEFLKALRAQLKRKLLIVWDGAAQHKSRLVRDYLDSLARYRAHGGGCVTARSTAAGSPSVSPMVSTPTAQLTACTLVSLGPRNPSWANRKTARRLARHWLGGMAVGTGVARVSDAACWPAAVDWRVEADPPIELS